MKRRYRTESGSTYEVDGKRFRRVSGSGSPTQRVGMDGQWRDIADFRADGIGLPLIIIWPWTNDDGTMPATITSPVVDVEDIT